MIGIRIVKFYAWEQAFVKRIYAAREPELKAIKRQSVNRSYFFFIMQNTTTIIIGKIYYI